MSEDHYPRASHRAAQFTGVVKHQPAFHWLSLMAWDTFISHSGLNAWDTKKQAQLQPLDFFGHSALRQSGTAPSLAGLSWRLSTYLLRLHYIKWLSPSHLVHLSFFPPLRCKFSVCTALQILNTLDWVINISLSLPCINNRNLERSCSSNS